VTNTILKRGIIEVFDPNSNAIHGYLSNSYLGGTVGYKPEASAFFVDVLTDASGSLTDLNINGEVCFCADFDVKHRSSPLWTFRALTQASPSWASLGELPIQIQT
jgi:hypothetical protein